MDSRFDKLSLKRELESLLAVDVETLERAQRAAVDAATHEEAKPENDKDTRALEASYLARGHALRLEELRTALAELRAWTPGAAAKGASAVGCLVTAEDEDGDERVYFLAPHGGGQRLAATAVQVVTPKSPLGRALLGKSEGDEAEVVVEGRRRALAISSVR